MCVCVVGVGGLDYVDVEFVLKIGRFDKVVDEGGG